MGACDPKIVELRKLVTAARQEFDMAVAFHEVWKPAAYDSALHARMGASYASQAFLVIRTALRREMLLALMRVWDKNRDAVRMTAIRETLRTCGVIDALATDRVNRISLSDTDTAQVSDDLGKEAKAACSLIDKYLNGGSHNGVLENLKTLRDQRLAHRQLEPAAVSGASSTDKEIEEFYRDTAKLIHILMSLVNATAYDPEEAAEVYRHYAAHFWVGARGERTEGHPNYRPDPT